MASFLRGVPPRLLPLKNARPACTRRSCERKFHRSVRKTGENRKNPRPSSVPTFPPLRRQRFFGNAARSFTLNRRSVQKNISVPITPGAETAFWPHLGIPVKEMPYFYGYPPTDSREKNCAAVTMAPSDGRPAGSASGAGKGAQNCTESLPA